MGEDVGKLGGVFRVTDGLQKDFGEARVIDTPLAESGIIGTAIGLALRGYRPICEIQFDGFVFPAFDQIVTQLAKMRYRSLGTVRLPVTIRIPFGGGIGAVEHHSESPEALFAHTPGLRVVSCGDPADAYAMIQQAAACDDPVVFFEPKRRYWDKADVDIEGGLAAALPMESARVLVPGTDVTVLCYGPMVRTCAEAAVAAASDGKSIEVIDLRSLAPLDTRDDLRLGPQDRPVRGRARGRGDRRHRRRDRGPGHARNASTTSRLRYCASARTPPRIRHPGWRSTTCLTWTGSWTLSTAPSATERPSCQISRSSSSLTSEKA